MPADPLPAQRWVRPLERPPGFWKQQLPTRALAVAVKGDLPGLARLLAERPAALNQRGPHGRTLLWEAARRGHTAALAWLLARGADVTATGAYNAESLVQLTPYAAAVYYRRTAAAEALAAAGGAQSDIFRAAFLGEAATVAAALAADPALLHAEDPHDPIYYVPLLAFAVAGGQATLAAELIARGAVVTRYSTQLLHLAARLGRFDLVTLLLDHGADARTVDSSIFITAADEAVLRLLLARGASANVAGPNRFPPLVFAARGDKGAHPAIVALLLAHGAAVNAPGPQGRTALHYAAAAGHADVVALLLKHGADPAQRDADGQTPRDRAAARGHTLPGL